MIPERLKDHLRRAYALDSSLSEQLWQDLLVFFQDDPQEYIRSRHLELQDQGFRNEEIYRQLAKDVQHHLFRGPKLSQRQIRRAIYG